MYVSQILLSSWLLGALGAEWSYKWPYGSNNACQCQEDAFGLKHFSSREACLRSFAEEKFETCLYKDSGGESGGLRSEHCSWVVSQTPFMDNRDCEELCDRVVVGQETLTELLSKCSFEFVAEYEDVKRVALKHKSCFSTYVYGFSDYDAETPALKVLQHVPSPAKCQALCQQLPGCVYFQWKAFEETESDEHPGPDTALGFQNPPHTCVLQSKLFIDSVLTVETDALDAPRRYCDVRRAKICGDVYTNFDIFHDKPCLICHCVPKCAFLTEIFVSGPAFCGQKRDLCDYNREVFTTTEEPPCPTVECEAPQKIGFFGHFKAAFLGDSDESEEETTNTVPVPSTRTDILLDTRPDSTTSVVLESTTKIILDEPSKI